MCTPTFLETSFTILGNSHVVPVVDRPLGLLLKALARGPELRIYSHKVRMYVSGMSRSGMSQEMLLHTIGIGHMCITQSDTFRYARLRYGDNSALLRWRWRLGTTVQRGHRGLGTTNTKQLLLGLQQTCATCASPAPT